MYYEKIEIQGYQQIGNRIGTFPIMFANLCFCSRGRNGGTFIKCDR